MMVKRK
ncbi:UNVERIFIED_CONTAM: hypothetical protein GTU68_050566 [Idotea baltica]|nr:hypothetical protein [Idotea baltica]